MPRDFYRDDDFSPCPPKCGQKDCRCECVEDPTIRDFRKQLCKLQGQEVTLINNNFFTITEGRVDEVNCGTVELIDAEVFGVDVNKVIVGLSTLNLIVPGNNNGDLVTALRTTLRP